MSCCAALCAHCARLLARASGSGVGDGVPRAPTTDGGTRKPMGGSLLALNRRSLLGLAWRPRWPPRQLSAWQHGVGGRGQRAANGAGAFVGRVGGLARRWTGKASPGRDGSAAPATSSPGCADKCASFRSRDDAFGQRWNGPGPLRTSSRRHARLVQAHAGLCGQLRQRDVEQDASMPSGYDPLYFASAILPDGRMIVEGGEVPRGHATGQTRAPSTTRSPTNGTQWAQRGLVEHRRCQSDVSPTAPLCCRRRARTACPRAHPDDG